MNKKAHIIVIFLFITLAFVIYGQKLDNKNDNNITALDNNITALDNINFKTINVAKIDKTLIDDIKLDNDSISINKDILELNGIYIRREAIIFLKGKCSLLEGKNIFYDNGKIQESQEKFNLKNEYFLGLPDYVEKEEISRAKGEIENILSSTRKDIYNQIAGTDDYREVIELLDINDSNLAYSMEKYSLILNATGKKFEDKKNIILDIFKSINKKPYIDENYLTGILYYYHSSTGSCNGFFNFLTNEFNK